MHNNESTHWIKIEAIIIDLIVASIIVLGLIFGFKLVFGKQIKITEYPEYGSRYGNIRIESLDVNLPLYYGDKLEILKNGVGQSSGAYFPGEGGTIICMGHNTKSFLYKLPEIKMDSIIKIETTYGTFEYKVRDTKIVDMYDVDELPVQKKDEILMLYTCYPVNGLGHKKDRFVVYARRIK